MISTVEDLSVKALMEKAIAFYVDFKEKEKLKALSKEQKEDLGLLALMQQADRKETVSRESIMEILDN